MTKRELAKLLGYSEVYIHRVFEWAEAFNESIRDKKGHYNKKLTLDYTLDECISALTPVFTRMQVQYVIDNFISRDTPYYRKKPKSIFTVEMRKFAWFHNRMPEYAKACSSCAFLTARKPRKAGCRYSPFCTLYNVFTNKAKPSRNIYTDHCDSYEESSELPLFFTKEGAVRTDSYGMMDRKAPSTTLGIDNDLFKGKRKKGEDIVLLNENYGGKIVTD